MPTSVDLFESVSNEVIERASKIKLLLMDVDGVLTEGKLYYLKDAEGNPAEFKGFNSQDGLGFHFLNHVGIKSGVISGRESYATTERARILKIAHVYQGFLEKEASYDEILSMESLTPLQTAFIGDDFTDVVLMKKSGLAVAVGNARDEVKKHAHLITDAHGGNGAVREVIEIILKSQGLWQKILDKYGV